MKTNSTFKSIALATFFLLFITAATAQTTNLAPEQYKHVQVTVYDNNGDYRESLLLLHEIYDGEPINADQQKKNKSYEDRLLELEKALKGSSRP